jgi:hypothetical protein
MTLQTWFILFVAYLFGSIPSAYIVSRLVLGKDIRKLGDGNMGAKNTFHSVGWLAGALVAVADITKGALAIEIARGSQMPEEIVPRETILALCALGPVLALSRNWDLSCVVSFILLVSLMWATGQPPRRLLYPFFVLPTIGARKLMQKWQAHHAAI